MDAISSFLGEHALDTFLMADGGHDEKKQSVSHGAETPAGAVTTATERAAAQATEQHSSPPLPASSLPSSPQKEDVSEEALLDLTTDPTKVVWVPARLHPTIAPHEFKSWLEEHASAVNHNETALGRRKSILSLHSYTKRASVSMNDGTTATVNEEDAAAASATFHDVADDLSTYDEQTSTLKAVLKRRLSLNVPKDLLAEVEGRDDAAESSSDRGSIRRLARARAYRSGAMSLENRGPMLSRRGAHRRFTSAMPDGQGEMERDANAEATSPTSEDAADAPVDGAPRVPIMDPSMRYAHMRHKEFTVLDRPKVGDSRPSLALSERSRTRSMDPLSDAVGERPMPKTRIATAVRASRSTDNLASGFRHDEGLARSNSSPKSGWTHPGDRENAAGSQQPHDQQLHDQSQDQQLRKAAISLSAQRRAEASASSGKKGSSWSWLWGGDSNPDADSGRTDKTVESPTALEEASSPANSYGRHSVDIERLGSDITSRQRKDTEKEKKKKTGGVSFFFSSSRNKNKHAVADRPADEGADKSKEDGAAPPAVVSPPRPLRYTNYNRFPIHIERAIYRLSHVKLSNPRRPLVEQVLISNMMFWYLSLISQQGEGQSAPEGRAAREAAAVKSRVGKGGGGRKKQNRKKQKPVPLLGQEFTTHANSSTVSMSSDDNDDDEDDVPLAHIRTNTGTTAAAAAVTVAQT
ncbi:hypothetical protein THASP1DRAFT_23534 [Thamnocephalis sphaerospora]|uniref:Protein Zds1 C-terminal domain-containing protein n=1 Tax=Thamnocephalis sphaerospora TaxID=78915 RepID=A0A4P9XSV6_9FUNG|nr:hypothetical protein THASP1DRAFT_23534 [Thamnocephalis sphaerospora]|eukprot:RKP08490.1 hypothetical protein THASP1DRAFT_23534 [Thamnocephalis sphaerospora]